MSVNSEKTRIRIFLIGVATLAIAIFLYAFFHLACMRVPHFYNTDKLTIKDFYKRDSLTLNLFMTDVYDGPWHYAFNAESTLPDIQEKIIAMSSDKITYSTELRENVLVITKISNVTSYYCFSTDNDNHFYAGKLYSYLVNSEGRIEADFIFPAHLIVPKADENVMFSTFSDGETVGIYGGYAEWKDFYGALGISDFVFNDEQLTIKNQKLLISFIADNKAVFSVAE